MQDHSSEYINSESNSNSVAKDNHKVSSSILSVLNDAFDKSKDALFENEGRKRVKKA